MDEETYPKGSAYSIEKQTLESAEIIKFSWSKLTRSEVQHDPTDVTTKKHVTHARAKTAQKPPSNSQK